MWEQRLYDSALRFAARAHDGQTLPGSRTPYIVHPVSVAQRLLAALLAEVKEHGIARDFDLALQCALLHDVLEDTDTSAESLRTTFGCAVAEGVQALSKDPGLPREERMADSLRRLEKTPAEVRMVKLADRICNLAPPPRHWSREKVQVYHTESYAILKALEASSALLAEELTRAIKAYAVYC